MISKNEVKYIRSLGQQKGRLESGTFLAEGPKIVAEMILRCPNQIEKIYATSSFVDSFRHLSDHLSITEVDEEILARISQLQTPNQALAVIKKFDIPLPNADSKDWIIMLDGIQDPGNFGTIIRIADWFGVKNILCTRDCPDCFSPKVVQASMGSIARVGVHAIDLNAWFSEYKGPVIGAMLDGINIQQFSFPQYGLIVIGREGAGIRPDMRSFITQSVSIPSFGHAESLNAAVASGIVLWELKRGGLINN
jgi:TrmH family RNA methyltransferase